jgi:ribosomal protein L40E
VSFCPQCGTENSEGARFCQKCGGVLQAPSVPHCPSCGAVNSPEAAFCNACGASLRVVEPPTPPAAPPPPTPVPVPPAAPAAGSVPPSPTAARRGPPWLALTLLLVVVAGAAGALLLILGQDDERGDAAGTATPGARATAPSTVVISPTATSGTGPQATRIAASLGGWADVTHLFTERPTIIEATGAVFFFLTCTLGQCPSTGVSGGRHAPYVDRGTIGIPPNMEAELQAQESAGAHVQWYGFAPSQSQNYVITFDTRTTPGYVIARGSIGGTPTVWAHLHRPRPRWARPHPRPSGLGTPLHPRPSPSLLRSRTRR